MEVEQEGAHDVELRVELAIHSHDMVEEHRVEVFGKLFGKELPHLSKMRRADDNREVTHASHRLGITYHDSRVL